jgi:hypothetical protein
MNSAISSTLNERSASNVALPGGLRLVFGLGAAFSLLIALACMLIPGEVARACGLNSDALTLPVFQQAGASVLGYAVAAFLCMRAANWQAVRIAVAGSVVFALLSALGAFYYVVLVGVATAGLVFILAYSLFLTVGLGYYLIKYR